MISSNPAKLNRISQVHHTHTSTNTHIHMQYTRSQQIDDLHAKNHSQALLLNAISILALQYRLFGAQNTQIPSEVPLIPALEPTAFWKYGNSRMLPRISEQLAEVLGVGHLSIIIDWIKLVAWVIEKVIGNNWVIFIGAIIVRGRTLIGMQSNTNLIEAWPYKSILPNYSHTHTKLFGACFQVIN